MIVKTNVGQSRLNKHSIRKKGPMAIVRRCKKQKSCITNIDNMRVDCIDQKLVQMSTSRMKLFRKRCRDLILCNSGYMLLGGEMGKAMDEHLWKRDRKAGFHSKDNFEMRQFVKKIWNRADVLSVEEKEA